MKNIILIISVLISTNAIGQISNINLNGVPARTGSYQGVEGSPYLFDDFSNADLSIKGGKMHESVPVRFNIHENEMEAINDNGNKLILDKKSIEFFILERPRVLVKDGMLTKLVFKKGYGQIKGVTENDFVNVLGEGAGYNLVRKYYSNLISPPTNSYAPSPGKMFIFEETLYLLDESGNVKSVRANNKKITNGVSKDDKNLAKEIIKENKLDLSKESHIILFFNKMDDSKKGI